MKQGIHPENYRLVAFKDMSNEDVFITKSTAPKQAAMAHLIRCNPWEFPGFWDSCVTVAKNIPH